MADQQIPPPNYTVKFCTNIFTNVPVILQYDDTPLLWVTQSMTGNLETEARIYSQDGEDLGRWKGKSLHLTGQGKKAGLTIEHPAGVDVLKMGTRTLCELRKPTPLLLHPTVELYSPTGTLLTGAPDIVAVAMSRSNQPLELSGMILQDNLLANRPVGIHITSDGQIAFGGLVA